MTENSNLTQSLDKKLQNTCNLSKKSIEKAASPLSKYYLFFFDLFTWKYPRTSGLALGGIIAFLLFSNSINIPHLILRTAWILFASSTIIEITGRYLFKQPNGFISQFAPSSFYSISRESLDNIINKTCDLTNFMLHGFQELLFAKKIKHTAIAFTISWVSFVLMQFFSFVYILLLATLLTFTLPLFYIKYQKTIDKYVAYISIFANKYSDILKKNAKKCIEKMLKGLSFNAIKLVTKMNNDINKFKNGFMKSKSLLNLKVRKIKPTSLLKTPVLDSSATQEALNIDDGVEKHDTNVLIAT
ncbi:hypothetical protein PCANB_002095 [Pneumocystis canis]|nr:hypothetical protein PCK1_001824 [Pneumocystis canis]KAG5439520.1 hypothetical protein PCANB_002095 [Pneumocystis canis]